ncbi:MAG: AAA family ATPase, partial [Chloroflexi bacterium]|nr:AAA family ATPase [Chloroflexota bacterium]
GAGKTTLAKKLEAERPALRLTPDEWIPVLYGENLSQEKLDSVREPVETMQWQVASAALRLGVDVVLDFGFWGRSEREDFRARAAALGAQTVICFLDISYAELSARLAARNASLPPGTFHVSQAQLDLWWSWFEPPTPDELDSACASRPNP